MINLGAAAMILIYIPYAKSGANIDGFIESRNISMQTQSKSPAPLAPALNTTASYKIDDHSHDDDDDEDDEYELAIGRMESTLTTASTNNHDKIATFPSPTPTIDHLPIVVDTNDDRLYDDADSLENVYYALRAKI